MKVWSTDLDIVVSNIHLYAQSYNSVKSDIFLPVKLSASFVFSTNAKAAEKRHCFSKVFKADSKK